MIREIQHAFSRLISVFRKSTLDQDFEEELSAYIDMLTQENLHRGLSADDARRQAILRVGGLNATKDLHRETRGVPILERVFHASCLDLKFGLRMLVKSPGLTTVGVIGMGVAIAIGAGIFAFSQATIFPTLPLEGGDRLVGIENWDTRYNNQDYQSLHDFVTWRSELKSIQDVAAFRAISRNLLGTGHSVEQVRVAEITAEGLRTARVPAQLGRILMDEDERKGAPDVVVIGHEIWQKHFMSDPGILGRNIRLGNTVHTIVGVMPAGFAFPINDRFWIPLRAEPSEYRRGSGPELFVFGRLAPGFTMETAQAEVTTLGARAAEAFPEVNGRLRPRVVRYAAMAFDDTGIAGFAAIQFIASVLLIVICANVDILIYARTANRQSEIAVRHALGASRGRIIGQLFAESVVLASVAAGFALILIKIAIAQAHGLMGGETGGLVPFWITRDISTETFLVTAGFTVLAAAVAGIVPALKATGRGVEFQLRQLGRATGMQLGRTWTALIVGQIAVAVAFLPGFNGWESTKYGISDPGFAATEFSTTRIELDREVPASANAAAYRRAYLARYDSLQKELMLRLESEPSVSAVTRGMGLPGEESAVRIEVEGGASRPANEASVRYMHVDLDYFETFSYPSIAGRLFTSADFNESARPVVVNRSFVDDILGGTNPLGKRLRYVQSGEAPGEWLEIIGVVGNLPAQTMAPSDEKARLYHPLESGQIYPALAIRLRDRTPSSFAPRLLEVAAEVDPSLRARRVMPLDDVYRQEEDGMRILTGTMALLTLSVLLLSAAGIYALMSLTVARRRKEIGIRTALGADRRRILGNILARALLQLVIGVAIGGVAALALDWLADGDMMAADSTSFFQSSPHS